MWIGNYKAGNGIRLIDRQMNKTQFKQHYRLLRMMISRLDRTEYRWQWYYDSLYRTVTQREVNALKKW